VFELSLKQSFVMIIFLVQGGQNFLSNKLLDFPFTIQPLIELTEVITFLG
jgi:hypothetical protein